MTFLIIHGIGGHAGIHWQQWLSDELIKEGHTVIMPDLPNSDRPDRMIWLNEIATIAKDTKSNELIIVGHSLGVPTALDFIEQAPNPIKALVCVSGFVTDYGAELNSYFMATKSINFNKVRQNISHAYVIYGDNDSYVSQGTLKEVAMQLKVEPTIIHNGGHLNTEAGYTTFPALLKVIETIVLL